MNGYRRGVAFARLALLLVGGWLLLTGVATAQPFGSWLTLSGPTHGYLRVPDSAELNPTSALTIEAWVAVTNVNPNPGQCDSIAGKNWTQSWWIGICGTTLRSFVRSGGINRDAGSLPAGSWTHVAVVFDGSHRLHYINGELAGSWAESSPLTPNGEEVRIGSDVQFPHTPQGAIDEVRLWNVARTQAQIRANLNKRINTPQPGLVAVWALDGVTDPVGGHNGTLQGGGVGFLTFAAGPHCTTNTATSLCLNNRFIVTTQWRTNPVPGSPVDGNGKVAVSGPGSGVFWFFAADNWEVMVKALNGCGLDQRYWIFAAATTNVFYRLNVFDSVAFQNKVYFNYPGPPAPALTDTSAFATCP